MTGITDLSQLLKSLSPELQQGEFVFVSVQEVIEWGRVQPLATFREKEGLTLILERSQADALGYSYDYIAAWITLKVHSALAAVGLTAAFSNALAEQQISCNVMAGFYHDHIFVAIEDAQKALNVLRKLAAEG